VKSTQNAPFAIFLLYYHGVAEPIQISDLSYRAYLEELFNFDINRRSAFRTQFPSFLLDRFERRIDIQLVRRYTDINSGHIFRSPSERMKISF